ncbi:hypothetical protein TNCV_640441 [Trichonephila clavipes]|nr:hypothetical protein TNCV_640441 [Trichonephila clavipes]
MSMIGDSAVYSKDNFLAKKVLSADVSIHNYLELTLVTLGVQHPMRDKPNSVCTTLCPEVHEQVSRSGCQSDVRHPVLKFPGKVGTPLSTHSRDGKLSQTCPAQRMKLEPVVWKRDTLTTQTLGLPYHLTRVQNDKVR